MTGWDADWPCVARCPKCGAPGDVPCAADCEQRDFRDAEFADVDSQWPTDEERYQG